MAIETATSATGTGAAADWFGTEEVTELVVAATLTALAVCD